MSRRTIFLGVWQQGDNFSDWEFQERKRSVAKMSGFLPATKNLQSTCKFARLLGGGARHIASNYVTQTIIHGFCFF